VLLAALGSLATAAALSSAHRHAVEWAAAEVERFRGAAASPWAYAAALLDCVVALRDVGEPERAQSLLNEASAIATAHRFHALQYRAESTQLTRTTPRPDRACVAERGNDIVRSVHRLAPRRLPRHVSLATAGA
jgi:hypothetical protein